MPFLSVPPAPRPIGFRPLLAALCILALASVTPAELEAQVLTAEDIAELQAVSAVALSPDGHRVVFSLTVPRAADEEPGRDRSRLYVADAREGAEPEALLPADVSAGQPGWTPDGTLVTFTARLTDHHDQTQVYGVPAGGGEPRMLTGSPHGVMAYAFSSDGERVAYTAREPLPREVQERRDAGWDMIVHGENVQHVRLWTEETGGGQRSAVTPEDLTVWSFQWSPDGERFAVQVTDEPDADSSEMFRRLKTVPAGGGTPELMAPTRGKLGAMAWSPDGAHLALLGAKVYSDPLPQRVWVIPADGGTPRDLTPDDYRGTPEWVGWLDDHQIVTAGVESTRSAVVAWALDGSGPRSLMGPDDVGPGDGPTIIRSLSLATDRDRFAAPGHTRRHPAEVFVGSLSQDETQRVTHHNRGLAEVELGAQETVAWEGADGLPMEGVLIRPVGHEPGQRVPLAILPHGGPEGISIDGWNTRSLYPGQLLAGRGFAVFKPNYRGSGGLGTAFASANHRDLGGREFDDVLLGIDHLADEGVIDPQRVGISGTSYGGYFAAWAGTRHSDRFAAAITFAGLSNWISFSGTTDIPYEMADVHWDLWWFDNPGQHWDRSPVAWLDHADTPILVAHGLADERVHPEQSIQLHQFLELKDIPTGLVLYPRQPHGLTERAHRIDFMQRVVEWFEQHL